MLREAEGQRARKSPLGECAACGVPAECAMWELPVCYRCYSAWLEEPAPDYAQAFDVVRDWARRRRKAAT